MLEAQLYADNDLQGILRSAGKLHGTCKHACTTVHFCACTPPEYFHAALMSDSKVLFTMVLGMCLGWAFGAAAMRAALAARNQTVLKESLQQEAQRYHQFRFR